MISFALFVILPCLKVANSDDPFPILVSLSSPVPSLHLFAYAESWRRQNTNRHRSPYIARNHRRAREIFLYCEMSKFEHRVVWRIENRVSTTTIFPRHIKDTRCTDHSGKQTTPVFSVVHFDVDRRKTFVYHECYVD